MCLHIHDHGPLLLIVQGQYIVPDKSSFRMRVEKPVETENLYSADGTRYQVRKSETTIVELSFETECEMKINTETMNGVEDLWLFNRKTMVKFRNAMISKFTTTRDGNIEIELLCDEFTTQKRWSDQWE